MWMGNDSVSLTGIVTLTHRHRNRRQSITWIILDSVFSSVDLAAPHRRCNYTNVVSIFIVLSAIRCSIRIPEWLPIVSFRSTL